MFCCERVRNNSKTYLKERRPLEASNSKNVGVDETVINKKKSKYSVLYKHIYKMDRLSRFIISRKSQDVSCRCREPSLYTGDLCLNCLWPFCRMPKPTIQRPYSTLFVFEKNNNNKQIHSYLEIPLTAIGPTPKME